jgi:hypothetical protein
MHEKPGSIVHVLVQPSPLFVLASSQASVPARTPSPHVVAHALGIPTQVHPVSTVQVAEQPSPAALPASSHASAPATIASPHAVAQVLGLPVHT